MSYYKKIVILSQIAKNTGEEREATGIVKLERISGRISGRAAVFNVETKDLQLGIKCKNLPLQTFALLPTETEFTLHSASDIEDCVCVVARESAAGFLPVLSGTGGKKGFSPSLLDSFVRNTTQNLDKSLPIYKGETAPQPLQEPPLEKEAVEEIVATVVEEVAPVVMDDEQIAAENYFFLEDAAATIVKKSHEYYKKISGELEELFAAFPEERALSAMIEGSYFARIDYVDNKYYAVGLISSGDEPQYICYAVPGNYSAEPPADLKGSCKWLPKSQTEPYGMGYWVMYQDTDTGDTVTDIVP